MTISQKAETFARKCHEETNHRYDDRPYSVHLEMVVANAMRFIHLIPEEHHEEVIAACWVHDCIEDCRQTYNDIVVATNEFVAEIAFALTTEKGKTRKERAGEKYYEGIRSTPYAIFVKICDRMANMHYSIQMKSPMANIYKAEMELFEKHLYHPDFEEMLDSLKKLTEE